MVKKSTPVPDAWDDDWESQADKFEESPAPSEPIKLTKAERLAQHAEQNRQLWESAETPDAFHFLAAKDNVPLKTEFKPALKVLARKPALNHIARQDPATGLSSLTLEDNDDEDEEVKKGLPTTEELRLKAQRDREEKQRRYEEVRARLFGNSEAGSGRSSPSTVTPRATVEVAKNYTGKGKNRGGQRYENRRPESQTGTRELFDPNYTAKPGSFTIQKRDGKGTSTGRSTPGEDDQVIRTPRGPDASGRGGFSFANRGGKRG